MSTNEHRPTARILDILEALADSKNGYTLTEIANAIGAPKSSIFPIVHTLHDRRYISFDNNTSKYSIGILTHTIGSTFSKKDNVVAFIDTEMKHIVEISSEACQMALLDGNEVLYTSKVDSPQPISLISDVGKKLPANCTALGKALLCDLDKNELIGLFPNGLAKLTENSITDIDVLYEQLLEIRDTQIANEVEESTEYSTCYAVPLRKNNRINAALSVTLPIFRADTEKIDLIKNLLLEAQQRIQSIMIERNEEI
ncbi:MAG: IclR family transcriptional regulator [Clostridioides sp.]|nr:IclR family transcriptional regulator [Clostridioides sp.]